MNTHFLMNIVVNNQLDLNLVDIYPDNSLKISCKLLNTFKRLQILTTTTLPKFGL